MKPGRRPDSPPAIDPGPKPTLLWLPISRLTVDLRYQRSLNGRRSQALIKKIAEEFSWKKFGTLSVSPLALESYALWDGQHRTAGARLVGITEVPCSANEAPTMQEQADLFIAANRDRVAVHSFAMHHALVAAGNAEAVTIARVCRDSDVAIARYPIPATKLEPNQTLAIGAIKKAIKLRGEQIAVEALLTLRSAYPNLPGALRAHLIEGLSTLLALNPEITVDRLVDALKRDGLRGIERRVHDIIIEQGESKASAVIIALRTMTGTAPKQAIKTNLARLAIAPTRVAPPSKVTAPAAPKPKPGKPITMPDLKPRALPAGSRDVTAALMGDPDPKRGR
jgi:hypothetical protein